MEYKYSVILKANLPKEEMSFLEKMCFKIKLSQGGHLLEFRCNKIDVSHHNYIEMEMSFPSYQGLHTVRVPHHYVLLTEGAEKQPPIGY